MRVRVRLSRSSAVLEKPSKIDQLAVKPTDQVVFFPVSPASLVVRVWALKTTEGNHLRRGSNVEA